MTYRTETVAPEDLARFSTRVRRTGGTIVQSSPVGAGYLVTYVEGSRA